MTGIAAAKWLASLAPPRETPRTGRPSAALARSSTGATAASECIPGQRRISSRVERDAADVGRDRGEHRLDRVELVGAAVAEQLAGAGHDVERVARADDRRHGREAVRAGRVVAGGDGLRGRREREQRVAAAVRRRAGMRGPARARSCGSSRPPCGGRRRRRRRPATGRRPRSTGTRPSRRSGRRGRGRRCATPRRTPAAARPPRTRPGAARARCIDADREHDAALHVDRARAHELVARARVSGRWSACATTVSRWPTSTTRRAPLPLRSGEQVRRVVGRRARDPLDLGLVGQQRRAHGGALLGAVHVAGRRRDAHQRLELAHRPPSDLRRGLLHPGVHDRPRYCLGP